MPERANLVVKNETPSIDDYSSHGILLDYEMPDFPSA
jgi:hypothetical protein